MKKITLLLAIVSLMCLLPHTADLYAATSIPGLPAPSKPNKETTPDLKDKTPLQVQEILASLSDEQMRSLLITTLQREAQAQAGSQQRHTFADFIHSLRERVQYLRTRIAFVFSGASQAPSFLPETLRTFTADNDKTPLWRLCYGLGMLLLIWGAVRALYQRLTRGLRNRLEALPPGSGWIFKFFRSLFRALLELTGLVLVLFIIVILYFVFFDLTPMGRPILIIAILSLLFYELLMLMARAALSSKAGAIRLLPLSDHSAAALSRLLSLVGIEITAGILITGLLQLYGSSEALYLLVLSCTGLLVVFTLSFVSLWKHREVAARLREIIPPGTMRHQLSNSWHLLFMGYLLFFWLFWVAHLIAFGTMAMLPGLLTLLAFPFYLLLTISMDKLVMLAGNAVQSSLLPQGQAPSDPIADFLLDANGKYVTAGCPVARFRRFTHKALSFILFIFFIVTLAHIWNIELYLATKVVRSAFSILLTILLGYIFWAFSKGAIERKLRSQAKENGGDEPGMGSGDRLHTLLELLKRFVFVAIVILVTLIVLSSLGVDTGPLLAGASVFGIAIGFGSQTLVKDIVSGVFFLMDDAFRIGDYIELGDSRGTVEGISVRSLKLRHHRGALYTVPYGSIHMVMNLSRDWAIMKLEYVVPHDTDIQVVKKIVKRINKELKEVPELAALMLGDVKSQGVKTIEEYGMRMRIKMTTTPGGQFTLRKWIWGKLRRYFDEAGIHFAYRKVSVMLPEGEKPSKETLEAAGAAAVQAMEQEPSK